jgi:hypothetical protein
MESTDAPGKALATRYAEAEAIRMAGEQDLVQRAAKFETETALTVAVADAAAEERVSTIKRTAIKHIMLADKRCQELERIGQEREQIIARQEQENEELRLMLAEHGVSLGGSKI